MFLNSKSVFHFWIVIAVLASVLGSAVTVTPAYAAGIVVNTNADGISAGDGLCTLREAINNANNSTDSDTTGGDCSAGSGFSDIITFAADYTITLAGSELPPIYSRIVITGNGEGNTIIEASSCDPVGQPGGCTPAEYRVFHVAGDDISTFDGNLTLNGLTVRHGRCAGLCVSNLQGNVGNYEGGGIFVDDGGALTASHVTLNANTATSGGGIFNESASLENLTEVTILGNTAGYGGGMYTRYGDGNSSPTLTDVTFAYNAAFGGVGNGGAMFNSFSSPILNTVTFHNNSAQDSGGGIYNGYGSPSLTNVTFNANSATSGGGIYNTQLSSPTLTNVTFGGNMASTHGGGIYNDGSSPTLINVTFGGNAASISGGGIYNDSNSIPTLMNTLVADSAQGGDCFSDGGSPSASSSNNLIGDNANACGLTNGTNGNIIGQDPHLGPLADNGGSTQTMALLAGSPAIDAGKDNGCPSTDQRGVIRPRGPHCDIGAFESPYISPKDGAHVPTLRPIFDWDDIPGASTYVIQISRYSTFKTILMKGNPLASTFTPTRNLPINSTLYWRYRPNTSAAWSTLYSFTTGNPPSIPVLRLPKSNKAVTDPTPLLIWSPSRFLTGTIFDHYQIQVDNDPAFGSPEVDTTSLVQYLESPATLLTDTTYYWRVKAFNSAGEYSNWQKKLAVFHTAMDAPVLSSPPDGASVLNDLRPTFDWPDSPEALYTFQLSDTPGFTHLVINRKVVLSTYTPTINLKLNIHYYWRVQVFKGLPGHFAPSLYSTPFGFTITP